MKKLQSLSLQDCELASFPELQTDVAITQVTTLKLLELYKCYIKGKKFEVIKRTPLLEELYIVDIEGNWDRNNEDNIEFFKTFSVPQTLQSNLVYVLRISNSDSISPLESVQYISKPPHGLTLPIMHNIREINMNDFDKVKYIFKLSIASLLMLEILRIKQCHGLEHIIDTEDEYGKENLNAIFPNLRELFVIDCWQLKYMLGQYRVANQDCGEEIHIHFSALERLALYNLPNFVSICATNNLTVTWPSLKELNCNGCSYPYNSINCLTAPAFKGTYQHFKRTGLWLLGDKSLDETEIGNIGNESIEEEPSIEEGDKTKPLSTGVEDISIGGGVATHIEFGDVDIHAQDSKVVEQDDKMNDQGNARIMSSQEIKVEEGLNLLEKQEEIHIVSNNNIDISPDIRTRLGTYKHFVDLDDAQIALPVEAITTYPHLWNVSEKFSERFQAWRLKMLADMLLFVRKESVDDVIPQREKEFHKLCEEALEIGFESSWVDEMRQHVLTRDPKLRKEIAERQMNENPKRCNSVDMVPHSRVVKQGDGSNENCKRNSRCVKTRMLTVASKKVLTWLIKKASMDKQRINEPCLINRQKSLGEIVSSPEIPQELNALQLLWLDANVFSVIFSSYSSKSEIWSNQTETRTAKESEGQPKIIQDFGANDIMSLFAPVVVGKEGEDNLVGKTLVELEKCNSSDGLKDIIGIMQQEFPSIVCTFKQGFATTEKLAEHEARGNEVAITFGSKISEAKNFYDEAQPKEVVLKEQIIRLKEEIKVCEDALSYLEEEKHKCLVETIGYKMELENVRKDGSQMVEDQRKVQQKLFEVTYKWSVRVVNMSTIA
ncbi:hypothetical protein ACSQ67_005421 [Phaseolus vulgaris]